MNEFAPHSRRRLPAVAGIAGCALLAASLSVGAGASAMAAPLSLTATDSATLIAAITQANVNPGHDTITLPAGTITLDADLPTMDEAVTIVGAGSAETIIDGAGAFLTLNLRKGGLVSGLTVTGSNRAGVEIAGAGSTIRDVGAHKNRSGGIYLQLDSGTASLQQITTNDNLANGVEIYARDSATVTVDQLGTTGNSFDGIHVEASEGGQLELSTITAAQNGNHGVEIYSRDDGSAVTLRDSTIAQQTAAFEGLSLDAKYDSRITIARTVIADNPGGGAGVWINEASVDIVESTLQRNGNGTDIGALAGDVYGSDLASLTVSGSSITENHGVDHTIDVSQSGVAHVALVDSTIANNQGTGLYSVMEDESRLTIMQSTISGNHGSSNGAMKVQGIDKTAKVDIFHSTIVENSSYEMGGVTVLEAALLIDHSIVADNDEMADVTHNGYDFPTITHSLIREAGPESAVEISLAAGEGNLTDLDPALGALGANGGATLTHLPQAGSPVVDAGRAGFDGAGLSDQRREARVAGALIDMGSVEVQVPAVVVPEDDQNGAEAPAGVIAGTTPAGETTLPVTGGSISPLIAIVGMMLLGIGALATVGARRRASRS